MDISKIDSLIAPGRFHPRWGWHDDHRAADGTPAYLPALQQVRAEFQGLANVLERNLPAETMWGGRCLQLGVGECDASHQAWRSMFKGGAVTIDFNGFYVDGEEPLKGGSTHDAISIGFARKCGPYDFLFVDAGHAYEDVARDFVDYYDMVRKGGVIAFHDSLPRKGYEEVEVWRFLQTLGSRVRTIGSEVGTSWMVVE